MAPLFYDIAQSFSVLLIGMTFLAGMFFGLDIHNPLWLMAPAGMIIIGFLNINVLFYDTLQTASSQ